MTAVLVRTGQTLAPTTLMLNAPGTYTLVDDGSTSVIRRSGDAVQAHISKGAQSAHGGLRLRGARWLPRQQGLGPGHGDSAVAPHVLTVLTSSRLRYGLLYRYTTPVAPTSAST